MICPIILVCFIKYRCTSASYVDHQAHPTVDSSTLTPPSTPGSVLSFVSKEEATNELFINESHLSFLISDKIRASFQIIPDKTTSSNIIIKDERHFEVFRENLKTKDNCSNCFSYLLKKSSSLELPEKFINTFSNFIFERHSNKEQDNNLKYIVFCVEILGESSTDWIIFFKTKYCPTLFLNIERYSPFLETPGIIQHIIIQSFVDNYTQLPFLGLQNLKFNLTLVIFLKSSVVTVDLGSPVSFLFNTQAQGNQYSLNVLRGSHNDLTATIIQKTRGLLINKISLPKKSKFQKLTEQTRWLSELLKETQKVSYENLFMDSPTHSPEKITERIKAMEVKKEEALQKLADKTVLKRISKDLNIFEDPNSLGVFQGLKEEHDELLHKLSDVDRSISEKKALGERAPGNSSGVSLISTLENQRRDITNKIYCTIEKYFKFFFAIENHRKFSQVTSMRKYLVYERRINELNPSSDLLGNSLVEFSSVDTENIVTKAELVIQLHHSFLEFLRYFHKDLTEFLTMGFDDNARVFQNFDSKSKTSIQLLNLIFKSLHQHPRIANNIFPAQIRLCNSVIAFLMHSFERDFLFSGKLNLFFSFPSEDYHFLLQELSKRKFEGKALSCDELSKAIESVKTFDKIQHDLYRLVNDQDLKQIRNVERKTLDKTKTIDAEKYLTSLKNSFLFNWLPKDVAEMEKVFSFFGEEFSFLALVNKRRRVAKLKRKVERLLEALSEEIVGARPVLEKVCGLLLTRNFTNSFLNPDEACSKEVEEDIIEAYELELQKQLISSIAGTGNSTCLMCLDKIVKRIKIERGKSSEKPVLKALINLEVRAQFLKKEMGELDRYINYYREKIEELEENIHHKLFIEILNELFLNSPNSKTDRILITHSLNRITLPKIMPKFLAPKGVPDESKKSCNTQEDRYLYVKGNLPMDLLVIKRFNIDRKYLRFYFGFFTANISQFLSVKCVESLFCSFLNEDPYSIQVVFKNYMDGIIKKNGMHSLDAQIINFVFFGLFPEWLFSGL